MIPETADKNKKDNADSKVIWMDGKLLPYHDARVHVLSHSLHYGGGVFEGIRAYQTKDGNTAIFRAREHFERFVDSMSVLGYASRYTVQQYIDASIQTIRENGFKECYVRPLAYIDDAFRGLKLPDAPEPRVAIASWPWGKYLGNTGAIQGISAITSTFRRADVASSLPLAKIAGAYVTSVLARREATQQGCDEALLLDPNGFVAEGSGENIFVIKHGRIVTPPAAFILPGITRDSVIQILRDLGHSVSEENITRNQVYLADEAFFTGTAVEVTPIKSLDHRRIGGGEPGPLTRKVSELFFQIVRAETPKYAEWRTLVY